MPGCPNFQKKCPYCIQNFNQDDNIYLFSHDDPLSFHCVHMGCLPNVVNQGAIHTIVPKCPSCNKPGTYCGYSNYATISNGLMERYPEYCGEVLSSSSSLEESKEGSKNNPIVIGGIKRKKSFKTKRNAKKSKKGKRRNKTIK